MPFKNIISLVLAFLMVWGMLPFEGLFSYADDKINVEKIEMIRTYKDEILHKLTIRISGQNVNKSNIYFETASASDKLLPQINDSGYVVYELTEDKYSNLNIQITDANKEVYSIAESNLPTIESVDSSKINIGKKITITGEGFDKVKAGDIDGYFKGPAPDDKIIGDEVIEESDNTIIKKKVSNVPGTYSIEFKQTQYKYNPVKPTIIRVHNYEDKFSVYGNLDISENIEMIPSRGPGDSSVYFRGEKIPNLNEIDVFFLKNTSDSFTKENKAQKLSYNENKYGQLDELEVRVPSTLDVGEEYFVIFTNAVGESLNIEDKIIKQKILKDKFFVVEASNLPSITGIKDDTGSSAGGYTATIEGEFLGSFSDVFDGEHESIKILNKNGVIVSSGEKGEVLQITYGSGFYRDISDKEIMAKSVIKEITGIIGNPIYYNDYSKSSKLDSKGIDEIVVEIPQVGNEDIQGDNAAKEVILIIKTIIEYGEDETIEFSQVVKNKDVKFTFIPTAVEPSIENITPPSISVERDEGKYKLKKDVRLVIKGSDFLVHEYQDEDTGDRKYRYPTIEIGDVILDKNKNSEIGLEILNPSGLVQGTKNNDIGNKLIIVIPKGTEVPSKDINRDINLTVTNPLRNSEGMGYKNVYSGFRFVHTDVSNQRPVISSVNPYSVTMDAGETIIIKGSGFQEDVKLVIEGKEIEARNFNRISETEITFIAPPSDREIETQIQVINPSYGTIDVHPFIYTRSITDPAIYDFNPKERTAGSYFTITGKDFRKPNPTASKSDVNRLVGTKVMIGNTDVNDYYPNNTSPELIEYKSTSDKKILQIEGEGILKSLKLAEYYHSVLLTRNSNIYTLDINSNGQIELYDGDSENDNRYILTTDRDGVEIIAIKQDENKTKYNITPTTKGIEFRSPDKLSTDSADFKFTMETLYKVENNKIVGNRVKVLNENKIHVEVPELQISQNNEYSITVVNPDAKRDSKNGFIYVNKPEDPPTIEYLNPNKGSHKGGYEVEINGTGFFTTSSLKPIVVINGELVNPENVRVGSSNKIMVTVPPYTGPIDPINGTPVLVNVINPDGKGADETKGFTYVYVDRDPYIDTVETISGSNIGSTSGGDIVIINGYNFKLKEPNTGNLSKDDLNGNGKRDDFTGKSIEDIRSEYKEYLMEQNQSYTEKGFQEFIEPILPKVHFGSRDNQAQIVGKMTETSLEVISPAGKGGTIDVYVVNNDYGISNKRSFVYKGTNPGINNIDPPYGSFEGNEQIRITGDEFHPSKIKIYQKNDTFEDTEMMLVQFVNRDESTYKGNTLITTSAPAIISLNDESLIVRYDDSTKDLTVNLKQGGNQYKNTFNKFEGKRFIPLNLLENEENDSYNGFEMIMVEVKGNQLYVERGYSDKFDPSPRNTMIKPYTPAYLYRNPEMVSVIITNSDGELAEGEFEYIDFDTEPFIVEVIKNENDRGNEDEINLNNERKDARVLDFDYRGGNLIKVEGIDFLNGAEIKLIPLGEKGESISIESDVAYKNINDDGKPESIEFIMPTLDKDVIGEYYSIQIINMKEGNISGVTSSDKTGELRDKPIVLLFKDGGEQPIVTEVIPAIGPQTGGTSITVLGNNFKNSEGDKKLKVLIGNKEAISVEFISSKEIRAITPGSNINGEVDVIVINPSDATSIQNGIFTYLSNPKITSIVDPTDPDEKSPITTISILGEQQIKLKGAGFMEGAEVHFAPKITPLTEDTEATGNIIYIEGKPYILEESIEGIDYEWINNETITIKTPKSKTDNFGVIIINPDGGASPIYTDLTYGLPEIAAPSWIAAELVYDRFIRVHWGPVSGASEYEIHVVTNETTIELVGSTQLTSFAYNDIEPNTSYRFIVKALGDFGSSKPSMESNTVRTGKVVGPPDEDGGLSEDTSISKTGNVANVVIGSKDRGTGTMQIDLTKGNLAGSKDLVISLPASVITDSRYRNIQVIGKDFTLEFQASAFDLASIRENSRRTDAGVRFKISPYSDNTEVALGNQLSTVYNLEASAYVGKTNTPMDYLAGSMNFILDYDVQKANLRRLNSRSLQYFDLGKNSWQPLQRSSQTMGHSLAATVNRLGRYTIIGRR